MAESALKAANTVRHIKPRQLVEHWVHIDGHNSLTILKELIMPRSVAQAGQYVELSGSGLMCPVSLRHLLDDRVKLAHEVILIMASPSSGLAFVTDHRHCSDISTKIYASVAELVSPSVAPALRCKRPDLQRFVATVAYLLAAVGEEHASWISPCIQTRWDVNRGTKVAQDIAYLARQTSIIGKIVPVANASLSFGGKCGVAWLPDDKLLILLLLLFGPTSYINGPYPDFLSPLERQQWPSAIRFLSTTQ
jgi:hypothetical protein